MEMPAKLVKPALALSLTLLFSAAGTALGGEGLKDVGGLNDNTAIGINGATILLAANDGTERQLPTRVQAKPAQRAVPTVVKAKPASAEPAEDEPAAAETAAEEPAAEEPAAEVTADSVAPAAAPAAAEPKTDAEAKVDAGKEKLAEMEKAEAPKKPRRHKTKAEPQVLEPDAAREKFEPFKLGTLDHGEYDIAKAKDNNVTAIVFFATWSAKSENTLKMIKEVTGEYGGHGVAMIAVNTEEEENPAGFEATLTGFIERTGGGYPVMLDEGLVVYNDLRLKAMPTTYLVDRNLGVITHIPGAPSSLHETLIELIEHELGMEDEEEMSGEVLRYQAAKPQMLGYGMAKTLAERGKERSAIKKIDQVIKDDPNFPDAHALRGLLLYETGKADEAKAANEEALKLDPNLPAALIAKARFMNEAGDVAGAADTIAAALSKHAWGFTDRPEEEQVQQTMADLDEARKLDKEGDKDKAKEKVAHVIDEYVLLKKKVKINMKRMKAMMEGSGE